MSRFAFGDRLRPSVSPLWLALSLVWASVIVATGQIAWPLALWIATTVGPLTYLQHSNHMISTDHKTWKEDK